MTDPSLFTGRYDDALCAALAAAGEDVTLHGRPLRDTDAIEPSGYAYIARFFGISEALRGMLGEGGLFRAAKAGEYAVDCAVGPLREIASAQVVHAQWLPLAAADRIMLRRLSRSAALVHTVHNATAYHADDGSMSWQGRGYHAALDLFDALIVHGAATRDALLARGIAGDRLHIVPHPPMRLARAGQADLAEVPDSALPRLLFFGTIRPYKGVDILIEACLSLWRAGQRFELAIAGKPFMDVAPLLDRVRAAGFGAMLIADLGFLKERRLDAHLRKADILIFPYRHIDSSGALLSAFDYAKPMVASRVGMFADLAGDIVLCPPENPPALAATLLPLIADPAMRHQAGAAAKALGRKMGNWRDVAAQTATVYRMAIEWRAGR